MSFFGHLVAALCHQCIRFPMKCHQYSHKMLLLREVANEYIWLQQLRGSYYMYGHHRQFAIAPLADAAKQRGVHVYHLNIGTTRPAYSASALDAIRNIDRTVLEYSPSQGYRSYREKLVGYYKKYDINLSADDIIITTGGSEAVLFAFLSCLNPGDEIIVPNLPMPTIWRSPFRPERDPHGDDYHRGRVLPAESGEVRGVDKRTHKSYSDL